MVEKKRVFYFCIRKIGIAAIIAVSLCTIPHAWWARVYASAVSPEEEAILQAARAYLEAEVRRDLPKVYACLAPSSVYRSLNDYKAYLAEADASPVRIRSYKILGVKRIRGNHDPKAYPHVEQFAQVEVDIVIYYGDTQMTSEVNFDFTFIKEKGRWYKG